MARSPEQRLGAGACDWVAWACLGLLVVRLNGLGVCLVPGRDPRQMRGDEGPLVRGGARGDGASLLEVRSARRRTAISTV